ncbi:MAG: cupin domain-containing protein [Desulfuromonadales bacterium]
MAGNEALPPVNLFSDIPGHLVEEEVLPLLAAGNLRLERIVSTGHVSPPGLWYDQEEHEWVAVLRGWGVIEYADGSAVELRTGDSLLIPAHTRHRVRATSPAEATVWLALFYR